MLQSNREKKLRKPAIVSELEYVKDVPSTNDRIRQSTDTETVRNF